MKVLIIRFSSLGDIVLTEPISYILRKKFPEAQIDYLTKKVFVPLVQSFRSVDNIYDEDNKDIFKNRYDVVIDLHSKLKSFLYSYKIKSKKRLVYNKKHLLRLMIVKKLTSKSIHSTLDLYLTPIKKLIPDFDYEYPVLIPRKSEKVDKILKRFDEKKKILVIFPGAKHQTKIYPKDYLTHFINLKKSEYNVVLCGGSDEVELCKNIEEKAKGIINLTGEFSISELIYFISQADYIISNDSGPMHIAAALSKPQIAIFGSTSTALGFAPLNRKAVILEKPLPCRPCSLHGREDCPLKHFRCMRDITYFELIKAFDKLVEKY